MIPYLLLAALIYSLNINPTATEAELFHGCKTVPQLSQDPEDIQAASKDFGGAVYAPPLAVLRPAAAGDIAGVLRASYSNNLGFPVSARGHGHCTGGQARAEGGVVVEMRGCRGEKRLGVPEYSSRYGEYFVDVWGGELWFDVLQWTLRYGLAPRSWTDYLFLSVGGTLSNGGISGQAFRFGPQISNVFEMDVVTGKGEVVKCSREENEELFYAVLGGLGQFGIITRARIALERAPTRVRWIRVLYDDFKKFTHDQEYLLSRHSRPAEERFHYLEGFLVLQQTLINTWRSSFSPPNPTDLPSLLYCLELAINYHDFTSSEISISEEVESLLRNLQFVPDTEFSADLPYLEFLNRVHKKEMKLREENLWDVPHPWLNLFVPASRILEFDHGVFKRIIGKNITGGPILIYPMNRTNGEIARWEEKTSAVIPEEEVFYLVAFLRSAAGDSDEETEQILEYLKQQNEQILGFCRDSGIPAKQYMPQYGNRRDWEDHFGRRWQTFLRRKMEFDPKTILGTGQGIFKINSLVEHDLSISQS